MCKIDGAVQKCEGWENAILVLQIRALTAKLLALHALLGNRDDLDVASMLIKCPRSGNTNTERSLQIYPEYLQR